MFFDAKTRGEIEKQARLYDVAKEDIISRIQDNTEVAIKKLKAAERKLLEEVEIELGENPFAKLLAEIESESPPTDAEVRSVLENRIPENFGPSEESFFSLCREIEAFKSWRTKKEEKPSVPPNIRVKSTLQDSITFAWDGIEGVSVYQIEVDGSKFWEASTTNTFTQKELLPDTEHTFRIRAVRENPVSEWSGVVKGRTQEKTLKKSTLKDYFVNTTEDANVCYVCGKKIGPTVVSCGGKKYHHMCFNCNYCGKNIGDGNYIPFKGLSFCSAKCLSEHKKSIKLNSIEKNFI